LRVINLDETGIKLINNKKGQIYINKDDLREFVNGKYTIDSNNTLIFKNLKLLLSQEEVNDFSTILKYLKTEILKEGL